MHRKTQDRIGKAQEDKGKTQGEHMKSYGKHRSASEKQRNNWTIKGRTNIGEASQKHRISMAKQTGSQGKAREHIRKAWGKHGEA